jgi:hypothetical protein
LTESEIALYGTPVIVSQVTALSVPVSVAAVPTVAARGQSRVIAAVADEVVVSATGDKPVVPGMTGGLPRDR